MSITQMNAKIQSRKASLNGDFMRVLYILNMLTLHYIDGERDDTGFVRVEIVLSP